MVSGTLGEPAAPTLVHTMVETLNSFEVISNHGKHLVINILSKIVLCNLIKIRMKKITS